MWILQVLWAVTAAGALEVAVPERFLQPRTFNPHPYTDTTAALVQLRPLEDLPEHPYSLFRRPPSRGEDNTAPIQFPTVPESANVPQPRLKPASIKHPLNVGRIRQQLAPLDPKSKKKYAFSYAVRDRSSGDDFSHSQAGSGAQTKGEYRVKLPDGRTQVVSYTADHRGYRADVRYDEENFVEPSYNPGYDPNYKTLYKTVYKPVQTYKPSYKTVYLDYEDLAPKPQREYTPIHEEDYGDVDANTVSSTPRYPSEATAYVATATAKYVANGTPRYVETFVANSVGSTPSSINNQEFFVTTPSPGKFFVDADGQIYRQ